MEKYLDDSTDALTQKYLQYSQQWADEIASLDTTAEDYEEKAAAITEYYSDLCGMTIEEMSDMVKYGKDINEEYGTHAAETFEEAIIGKMYNDVETFDQLSDKINTEMQKSLTLISQEWTKYQENISLAMENAGTSVEGFKNNMESYMGNCVTYVNNLENKVGGLAKSLETNFNTALGKVKNFAELFKTSIQPAINSITTLSEKVNSLLEKYDANRDKFNEIGGYGGNGTGNNGVNGDGDGGGYTADIIGEETDIKFSVDQKGNYIANDKKVDGKTGKAAAGYVIKNGDKYVAVKEGEKVHYTENPNGGYTVTTTGRDKDTGEETTITTVLSSTELEKLTGQSITAGVEQYQHTVAQEANANATRQGYVKVQKDGKSWYTHRNNLDWIGKKEGSMPEPQQKVKVKDESKRYTYLVYDTNNSDKVIGGVNGASTITNKTSRKVSSWLGWNGEWLLGSEDMRNAMKERGAYIISHNQRYYGYNGSGNEWFFSPPEAFTDTSGWIGNTPEYDNNYDQIKGTYIKLDTGGYTGSWGPEGRLALLHQKEIVLNAHDTENFLAAIGIVRDISDQIEKNALAMQYSAALGQVRAAYDSTGTLQQEVTIHAEFPNATNHSEIEEAFKNLTNLASQYANRKF